jgi:hypothetical protein
VVTLETVLSVKVGKGGGGGGGRRYKDKKLKEEEEGCRNFIHLIDFDECGNHTDNCSALATCTNTIGSYNCSCNSGYIGTGFECEGILPSSFCFFFLFVLLCFVVFVLF